MKANKEAAGHRIDHFVGVNDMGDDTHNDNHVSPLCHHHWVDGLDGGTLVCAHKCGAWK